jgi:hypothetical protein
MDKPLKKQRPPASHCGKGPSHFLFEAWFRGSLHEPMQTFLNVSDSLFLKLGPAVFIIEGTVW